LSISLSTILLIWLAEVAIASVMEIDLQALGQPIIVSGAILQRRDSDFITSPGARQASRVCLQEVFFRTNWANPLPLLKDATRGDRAVAPVSSPATPHRKTAAEEDRLPQCHMI